MALARGKLVSFAGTGTWLAEVRLAGSSPQVMHEVKVSRGLASGALTAGRDVLVDLGDHGDPGDAVVVAVWA